jgi:ribosome assembly protein YihI (activator of Der GTPase)
LFRGFVDLKSLLEAHLYLEIEKQEFLTPKLDRTKVLMTVKGKIKQKSLFQK